MGDPSDRERIIRKLAAALELTDDETTVLLATPSEYAHWSKVYEDMARGIRERVKPLVPAIATQILDQAHLEQANADHVAAFTEWASHTAAAQIRNGFGDLTAPLAEGEFLHRAGTCPVSDECDWLLPMEWRNERTGQTTRLRGLVEVDALAQAHLETHMLANWKGPLHDR